MPVKVNGVLMRGLTPTLHRAFWPSSTHRKRTKGRERVKGNKRKKAALKNGQLTDTSLERLIRGQHHENINREAWMIKEHLDRRGVRMVETQTHVWNVDARVGTDLDLVGEKDGKMVIYEIKSGFRGYLHAYSGCNMSVPHHDCTDAVVHQHALQLAYGVDMYRMRFPNKEIDMAECAVLVVNDDLEVFPLRQLSEETLHAGWLAMRVSGRENVKKRTAYMSKQRKKRGRQQEFVLPPLPPLPKRLKQQVSTASTRETPAGPSQTGSP